MSRKSIRNGWGGRSGRGPGGAGLGTPVSLPRSGAWPPSTHTHTHTQGERAELQSNLSPPGPLPSCLCLPGVVLFVSNHFTLILQVREGWSRDWAWGLEHCLVPERSAGLAQLCFPTWEAEALAAVCSAARFELRTAGLLGPIARQQAASHCALALPNHPESVNTSLSLLYPWDP